MSVISTKNTNTWILLDPPRPDNDWLRGSPSPRRPAENPDKDVKIPSRDNPKPPPNTDPNKRED